MTISRLDVQAVVEALFSARPPFHGIDADSYLNWSLGRPVIDFIANSVAVGARTLETGCGYSTVVFAAAGARHTAVSPFAHEHERIRTWCEEHGVALDSVEFVAAGSQEYLPAASGDALDVLLVDGDHAFPMPSIDWYYAARRLRTGGLCIVDDVQIPGVATLDDFLSRDNERWERVRAFPTTHVYRRLGGPLTPDGGWLAQPWSARVRRVPVLRARFAHWREQLQIDGVENRLRRAVRARTRLRQATSLLRRSKPLD